MKKKRPKEEHLEYWVYKFRQELDEIVLLNFEALYKAENDSDYKQVWDKIKLSIHVRHGLTGIDPEEDHFENDIDSAVHREYNFKRKKIISISGLLESLADDFDFYLKNDRTFRFVKKYRILPAQDQLQWELFETESLKEYKKMMEAKEAERTKKTRKLFHGFYQSRIEMDDVPQELLKEIGGIDPTDKK